MPILPRTEFGNPILRREAKRVPEKFLKTKEFENLVRAMFQTCRMLGVGLAAPQIGVPLQLAVLEVPAGDGRSRDRGYPATVLVNPKIVAHSAKKVLGWEGCLSCPGMRGEVPRYAWVKVKYTNESGEEKTVTVRSFPAKVFQHEIDHLNGLVYIDRMKDFKKLITEKEYIRLMSR